MCCEIIIFPSSSPDVTASFSRALEVWKMAIRALYSAWKRGSLKHAWLLGLLLWLLVAMEICAKRTCWSPRKYLPAIALLPWLLVTMETCYINMLVTKEISSSQGSAGCRGNVFQPGFCWSPWKHPPAKALLVAKETSSSQGSAALAVGLSQKRLQVTAALNEWLFLERETTASLCLPQVLVCFFHIDYVHWSEYVKSHGFGHKIIWTSPVTLPVKFFCFVFKPSALYSLMFYCVRGFSALYMIVWFSFYLISLILCSFKRIINLCVSVVLLPFLCYILWFVSF